MEQDTNINQQLKALIAAPGKVTPDDAAMLKKIAERYPYFQPVHLLLAKAALASDPESKTIAAAALYTNGQLLHNVLYHTDELLKTTFTVITAAGVESPADQPEAIDEVIIDEVPSEEISEEADDFEEVAFETDLSETGYAEESHDAVNNPKEVAIEETPAETDLSETIVPEVLAEETPVEAPAEMVTAEDKSEPATDEQETFDEIGEIDAASFHALEKNHIADTKLENDLVLENIVSTDFFAFQDNFKVEIAPGEENGESAQNLESVESIENIERFESTEHILNSEIIDVTPSGNPDTEIHPNEHPENVNAEDFEPVKSVESVESAGNMEHTDRVESNDHTGTIARAKLTESFTETDENVVSKYDDDKLPYTFLWWLAKTRKEYQQIFQPYASPKRGRPNELQQQYVEHIFHLQSPFGDEEAEYIPSVNVPKNKGIEIIESFIRNEPQISPPNPEQINNENKAKKSAEDHNDLVSETLAKIYIEQMLYDKAIDTYEKLSLKFPEKSRYFADLIQSIEKKI